MIEVLDPRPPAPTAPVAPAARLGGLSGRSVLLFDNGKLAPEYRPRDVIFEVVRGRLAELAPDAHVTTRSQDLLVLDIEAIGRLAAEIASSGVDAVVLALVDAGVGMPTAVLAIELERRGVATCTVCEGPGLGVAAAVASAVAPALPLVQLPVLQGADREQVAGFTACVVGDVLAAVTGAAACTAGSVGVRLPGRRGAGGTLEIEGPDPTVAFSELMARDGLGDGFPLVAPTAERVAALVDATGAALDDVVWPALPIRGAEVLVRDVAVLMAMAGVEPRWAPVVLTAYRAMAEPTFRLFQAAITTHPGGTLVLVSGPAAVPLGIASGPGCLGPGHRANAAIGRAVALSFSFLLASVPGGADLSVQGSPAEYAYCCAENLDGSPWPGLHADLVGSADTSVTVLRCEGPKNVLDHLSQTPEGLLQGVASACATIHSNSAYLPRAQTVVFLNPAHAAMVASAGWRKSDVQRYLFEHARNPRRLLAGRGIAPIWPESFTGLDPVPVANAPEDFLVVVAGAPGLASQVAVPWGLSRAVTTTLPRQTGTGSVTALE